jgi:DNA-binding MarR family transcriptional regulator
MPDKFNPDSFAPFLDAMGPAKPRSAVAGPAALDLLKLLANAEGKQIELSEFLRQSGLGLEDFQRALKSFEGAGLVSRQNAPGGPERVVLTPAGEQLATLPL